MSSMFNMHKDKDNLDQLLEKYCEQVFWTSEQEVEPLTKVIEKVDKRFNIIRNEKTSGDGSPKRNFIPFYSHENDLFKDWDSAKDLFTEDENPEESEIGILSKVAEMQNNDRRQFTGDPIYDVFKMVGYCMEKFINSRECLKIIKDMDHSGYLEARIGINIFNPVFMQNLKTNLETIVNHYLQNYVKNIQSNMLVEPRSYTRPNISSNYRHSDQPYSLVAQLDKIVIELLEETNNIFAMLLTEGIYEYMDTHHYNQRGLGPLKRILSEYKYMRKSDFDETFDMANDFMFIMSDQVCHNIYERISLDDFDDVFDKIREKYFRETRFNNIMHDAKLYYLRAINKIKESFENAGDLSYSKVKKENELIVNINEYYPKKLNEVPKRNLNNNSMQWQ